VVHQIQVGEQRVARAVRVPAPHAVESQRELDVASDVEVRDQVVLLEHVPDAVSTERGTVGGTELRDVDTVEQHPTSIWEVEAAEEMQHRRLAAAARPHDGDPLAGFDDE